MTGPVKPLPRVGGLSKPQKLYRVDQTSAAILPTRLDRRMTYHDSLSLADTKRDRKLRYRTPRNNEI